jgi:hypothetical protein
MRWSSASPRGASSPTANSPALCASREALARPVAPWPPRPGAKLFPGTALLRRAVGSRFESRLPAFSAASSKAKAPGSSTAGCLSPNAPGHLHALQNHAAPTGKNPLMGVGPRERAGTPSCSRGLKGVVPASILGAKADRVALLRVNRLDLRICFAFLRIPSSPS